MERTNRLIRTRAAPSTHITNMFFFHGLDFFSFGQTVLYEMAFCLEKVYKQYWILCKYIEMVKEEKKMREKQIVKSKQE